MFATSSIPSPGVAVMMPSRAQGVGNALRATFSPPKVELPDDLQRMLDSIN